MRLTNSQRDQLALILLGRGADHVADTATEEGHAIWNTWTDAVTLLLDDEERWHGDEVYAHLNEIAETNGPAPRVPQDSMAKHSGWVIAGVARFRNWLIDRGL
jgi:hypothetical protein